MRKVILLFAAVLLGAALPLLAQSQDESLGDVAKQLREQHKDAKKPAKVFTNDNMPAPMPFEPINSGSGSVAAPAKEAGKPAAPATESKNNPPASKPEESQPGNNKEKTKEYWQGKFKAARQDVANAKKYQQLSEDELNLLQIQQAREVDPAAKADLTTKVQAKQSEVDVNQATTDAAQKTLDDLEKDFQESGAPPEWSQTGEG